mgnify:CR=1 FL=1
MTKRFGFTLAEVLITLGIIGVVAAMTMPTLINQTNGAQYKAAYKKALSAISQGVTLNVALDDIGFADTTVGAAANGSIAQNSTGYATAYLLAQRMNVAKNAAQFGWGTNGTPSLNAVQTSKLTDGSSNTTLFFNDGSAFQFPTGATGAGCTLGGGSVDKKICYGIIDVNGVKGPNKEVRCDDGTVNATSCTVKSPTDIYPVMFYDQTILPATEAARAVLYGK